MGVPYPDIELALNAALQTFATSKGGLKVAWENAKFTPTQGALWFKPWFDPVDAEQEFLGSDSPKRRYGIYQVTVFCPDNQGTAAVRAMAKDLETAFAVGTVLTHGAYSAKVTKVKTKHGAPDEFGWFGVPVQINWECWA